MKPTIYTVFIVVIFTVLFSNRVNSQPNKGRFLDANIGYGISTSFDDVDIDGSGFYAQAEYVVALTKWFGIRPYAGLIITSKNNNVQSNLDYRVTTKAFLLGGKFRVVAPIPWVAPYFELGIGTSIGSFETFTPFYEINKSGLQLHIPFTIGLAIGRNHNFDFAFAYYFHPNVEQVVGGVTIGFSFPLN